MLSKTSSKTTVLSMPENRFPDSKAKRELRRRDLRRLAAFKAQHDLALGLGYCGMPSVEFLDIEAWRPVIRSVCAVEYDRDVLWDMRISWDTLSLGMPVHFVEDDILHFLSSTTEVYDLYNLDFYGGFLNPTQRGTSRCGNAIRALVGRQEMRERSFVLIATFNVRDKGVTEYLGFVDEVPAALKGWQNVEECCRAHRKNNSTLLKLCFPYFCWQVGAVHNFSVRFEDPIVYHSSATMLHFYAEFVFQPRPLPPLTAAEVLASLASRPLLRLEGFVPSVDMKPPEVTKI